MKKIKIFSLAVMALLAAACSNSEMEDSAQPVVQKQKSGIPFKATISLASEASTRALSEEGKKLKATWEVGEQVAVIHNDIVDILEVKTVNEPSGSAEITGQLTGILGSETKVDVIYPASAVDPKTKALKADLLKNQDGSLTTISKNLDVRKGVGTIIMLSVGDEQYASFEKAMLLNPEYAIVKFSLTDGTSPVNASKFVIKDGDSNSLDIITTVTPVAGTSALYVAMAEPSGSNWKHYYQFEVTTSSSKTFQITKSTSRFYKGTFYQTEFVLDETRSVTFKTFDPSTGEFVEHTIPSSNVKNLSSSLTKLDEGTYLVDQDITIDNEIILDSEVNLILKDGKTLTLTNGLSSIWNYKKEATLNIYGEAEGTGKLIIEKAGREGMALTAMKLPNLRMYGGSLIVNQKQSKCMSGMKLTNLYVYDGTLETYGGPGSDYSSNPAVGYGFDAMEVSKDLYFYGGTVKAQAGNVGKDNRTRGGYAIIGYLHVSNKAKTLKSVTATGGNSYPDFNPGYALPYSMYYDKTVNIAYGEGLTIPFDTSGATEETKTSELIKQQYIKITAAP